jgi:hypothetical protein
MDSAISIFIPICGFFVAQIAQRIVVPLLVFALGEKRFASPSAFDGCTLGIAGGILAIVPAILLDKKGINPYWSLVIIFIGITLYGVVWLWTLGLPARKREWRLENSKILHENGEVLQPTFVRERHDYNQMGASNGYSHYYLDLYYDEEKLATNVYIRREERDKDLARVKGLFPVLRLDLTFIWREEPKRWRIFTFPDEWTPLLCGPLYELGSSQRHWWRQWTLPAFPSNMEIVVDPTEWQDKLFDLREAYPNYWEQYKKLTIVDKGWTSELQPRPQNWDENLEKINWLFENATSEIVAMTRKQEEKSAHKANVESYLLCVDYGSTPQR